jgi:hypothetical protein
MQTQYSNRDRHRAAWLAASELMASGVNIRIRPRHARFDTRVFHGPVMPLERIMSPNAPGPGPMQRPADPWADDPDRTTRRETPNV